MASPPSR